MAVLKLEGLRGLKTLIECDVPELDDKVCVDQAGAGHKLSFPNLSITQNRSRYFPDQEEESFEPSPNSVVLNVGRHVQDIVLKLGAATTFERAELEQKILNLFLVTDGHPGILFTQLTACENLGPFVASWELEEEDWQNEKAFDRQLYSELKITGILPALVTRRGVYNMNQLQIGWQIGVDVDPTADPPLFADTTIITINEDGTFTTL